MGKRVTIIGGGVSGLSLAYALKGKGEFDVTIFESMDRPGGKIWSDKVDGFLCEWGVNGFLDNKPGTLQLAQKLGLDPMRSSEAARKRFVYSGDRLHQLPESPVAFLKSALISWPGKIRLAMEPFIAKGNFDDESLADFGRRRLGAEAFQKLIDPMASGIFAGDPEKLSLKSCFKRINELEQKYGSLIKAMVSLMKERRKKVDASPGGALTSFRNGMGELIETLRAEVGDSLKLSSEAVSVDKSGEGYIIHFADGSKHETDIVALAVPAYAAAKMLKELDADVTDAVQRIAYPSLSVVCMGFRKQDVNIPIDCFGYLVPSVAKRKVLGTLYDSSVFDNRAPEGHLLLRTMVGGARASDLAMREDGKLLDLTLDEIRNITGLKADPMFHRIYKHEKAIPQYNVGHSNIVEAADAAMDRHTGLYITGNAFKGVSVNDCITNSNALAERIATSA
jgi:oxygen-dependent protoporphyrinogen oxidase